MPRSPASYRKVPLRSLLVIPFAIEVVVAVGLVGYFSFRNGQQAVEDLVEQLSLEVAARIQERLDSYLRVPHTINQLNADAARSQQLDIRDPRAQERHFWRQIQRFDTVSYIYFGSETEVFSGAERGKNGRFNVAWWSATSPNGEFYTYATDDEGNRDRVLSKVPRYDLLTRPWYRTAVEADGPAWGEIYLWAAPYANLALPAVRPFYDSGGRLQGVFAVDLSLLDISEFLNDLKVGQTGRAFIIERSGLLVANSGGDLPFANSDDPQRLAATESPSPLIRATVRHLLDRFERLANIDGRADLAFRLEGERQLVQVTPYSDRFGLEWLIVVVVPEGDFTARIRQNTYITFALCGAAFVFSVGLGVVTARAIVRPIFRLGEASRRLASGKLHTSDEPAPPAVQIDELRVLSESFDRMAAQLSASFDELERMNEDLERQVCERTAQLSAAEAELRGLFEAMTELIFVKDNWGRYLKIVSANPEWLVRPAEQMLGKTDDQLFDAERAARFKGYIRDALDRQTTVNVEYDVVLMVPGTMGARRLWFSASISPIGTDRVIWVAREVTDRKRAEEALRWEREKSDRLLLNILPHAIAQQLKEGKRAIAEHFERAAILFADIVGFTSLAERLEPLEVVDMLNDIFSTFDDLAAGLGIEKIKTIGDAYMAVAGLPVTRPDLAEAIADMALAMQIAIEHLCIERGETLQIRIGIHIGPVVAGVIGNHKFIYDLWGDAVNVASRMESTSEPGKIQVTRETWELLKDDYVLEERGTIFVKGKGEMIAYWLLARRGEELPPTSIANC